MLDSMPGVRACFGGHSPARARALLCTVAVLVALPHLTVAADPSTHFPSPASTAAVQGARPSGTAVGLHECVRSHLPPAAFPPPTKAIVSDLAAHVDHVLHTHAHASAVAFTQCGDARDIIFTPLGGFGDRVRGMVMTFYVALLTHSGFVVAWDAPFALSKYYHVRDLSRAWTVQRHEQRVPEADVGGGDPPASAVARHPLAADLAGLPSISAMTIDDYFINGHDVRLDLPANSSVVFASNALDWLELVRLPALRPVAAWYGLAGLTKAQLFRLAVQVIMPHPREVVSQAVDALLNVTALAGTPLKWSGDATSGPHRHVSLRPRSRPHAARIGSSAAPHAMGQKAAPYLVGVQIRTGGHGATWDDPLRHPVESATCHAAAAVEACGEHSVCTIAVTSDSERATALFRAEVERLQGEEVGRWPTDADPSAAMWPRGGNVSGVAMSGLAHRAPRRTMTVVEMSGSILHTRGGSSVESGGVAPPGDAPMHQDTAADATILEAGAGDAEHTPPLSSPPPLPPPPPPLPPPPPPPLPGNVSDPWLKTVVDWTLLARSDALLLSYSGFGWTAAWAGGVHNVRQLAMNTQGAQCAWFDMPALKCADGFYIYVLDIRCPRPGTG